MYASMTLGNIPDHVRIQGAYAFPFEIGLFS